MFLLKDSTFFSKRNNSNMQPQDYSVVSHSMFPVIPMFKNCCVKSSIIIQDRTFDCEKIKLKLTVIMYHTKNTRLKGLHLIFIIILLWRLLLLLLLILLLLSSSSSLLLLSSSSSSSSPPPSYSQ
jgi:hypothetical protein